MVRYPRVAVILLVAAVAVVVLGPPYAVVGRTSMHARPAATLSSVVTTTTPPAPIGPGRTVVARAPRPRPCRSGLVALTYDDGPSASLTPKFVRTLQKKRMRDVTFFMIGSHVAAAPGVARMVARAGFQIGNHTWDHPQLTHLSDAAVRREVRSTARALHDAGISPSSLVRPPYGDVNGRVTKVLHALHEHVALWTIDPRDWAGGSGAQIASRVLAGLRKHAPNVILDHDGVANSANTLRALPLIVRGVRSRGYCLTRLGDNGKPMVPVPSVTARVSKGAEAGTSTRPFVVHLRLSRPTTRPVSVRIRTAAHTAHAGSDYRPISVIAFFPAGATRAKVAIPLVDDPTAEPAESLWILLDRPRRLTIDHASSRLRATIADDDASASAE